MDCLMPELITSWTLHLMPNHVKKKSTNVDDPEVLKIICSKMLLKKYCVASLSIIYWMPMGLHNLNHIMGPSLDAKPYKKEIYKCGRS